MWALGNGQADPYEPGQVLNKTSDSQGGVFGLPLGIAADGEAMYPCFCMNYPDTVPAVSESYSVVDPSTINDSYFGNHFYSYSYDIMEKMGQLMSVFQTGSYDYLDMQFVIWHYTDYETRSSPLISLVDGPNPPAPVGVTLMKADNSNYQNFLCYDPTPAFGG
uniref:Uncharacterized protein n=1 Tax=Grammatophora oceanica TaxID=210454 RepID=A0A7S1UUM4_9STRA|mmetsp:Transcript_20092/g.29824  ORF Transcript_20092/g.29824 Transcript_20092/m.29824 type:complete len:163 (+) Transcript_20092:1153-1641(+)